MKNLPLFLFIIGTVTLTGYFILRFMINFSRKPILEINLSPIDNPKWSDTKKISDLIDSFQRNGFESAGHYACQEIPSLIISGFVRPADQIDGVIYDHPTIGIWVDVYVQYMDGASLTVSNAPTGQDMDHMPQQDKIYSPESSVDDLLAKILAGRKKFGRITITKEDFAPNFEAQYQKEMKWRLEGGGPTSLEVTRVANAMGQSLDCDKLQNTPRRIHITWRKEKNKPRMVKCGLYEAILPETFPRPDAFRQSMEQKSAPIPQANVPALPVYFALIAAPASWSYYGYRYNQNYAPVSLTELVIFFSIFLLLFVILMWFRAYHHQVMMCPFLKRIADLRPGAFLFIAGTAPTLFYARQEWIGKVVFREGSEQENACTRLEAVTKISAGSLLISRKNILNKIIFGSDKDNIPIPESDFGRKFVVSGTDTGLAEKMLRSNVPDVMMRLEAFKEPFVEIDRNLVAVEIRVDLAKPRNEAQLRQFLEAAETIIETVVQQVH